MTPARKAFAEMLPLPLWMESAPHNGTRTSVDAAHAIKPHVAAQRGRVAVCIAAAGDLGRTAQEIEDALSLSGNSVRPRIAELREHGVIRDSGRTRRSASGRACVVWEFVR